jgi:hypothetical protein
LLVKGRVERGTERGLERGGETVKLELVQTRTGQAQVCHRENHSQSVKIHETVFVLIVTQN